MSEVTRMMNTALSTSTRARAIDQLVLAATSTDVARKAQSLSSEIYSLRSRGFFADEEESRASHIARHRRVIAMAEQILASPEYRALVATLTPAVELATLAQIKQAIGGLIACYPTQADVAIFVAFAIEEVAVELPTVYTLAAACRELRRTKTFRPSIAEIIEALNARQSSWIRSIVDLGDEVESMRARLENAQ
jgi:hypothetical protein